MTTQETIDLICQRLQTEYPENSFTVITYKKYWYPSDARIERVDFRINQAVFWDEDFRFFLDSIACILTDEEYMMINFLPEEC